MEEKPVLEQPATGRMLSPGSWQGTNQLRKERTGLVQSVARLTSSGGLTLFRYLFNAGLFRDPGIIILSSHDHTNVSAMDLKRVTTLVSLRRLNLVKHLEMFINSLARILPPDTNFVGCFSPLRVRDTLTGTSSKHDGLMSWFFHSGGTECHALNRSKVSEMLERNGLSLISMTEMNGITYFHSRKTAGHQFLTA